MQFGNGIDSLENGFESPPITPPDDLSNGESHSLQFTQAPISRHTTVEELLAGLDGNLQPQENVPYSNLGVLIKNCRFT